MSYQHGYQQQPQGAYPGSYPEPEERRNPALAIVAGLLGLVAAAALVVINVELFNLLEGAPDEVFGEFTPIIIVRFAAAGLLLIGAIIVFIRKLAGAFVLVLGGLAGIAAILLFPVLLSDVAPDGLTFGDYLESLFQFEETQETFSAVALIASPLVIILAILPPTLNYLRGPSDTPGGSAYGGHPQQPQQPGQGW
jgi:hypothetical protein